MPADIAWQFGSASGNIASTTLDSKANGSESTVVTYDNSTNKNLYGEVKVKLGSITPTTGGSITLRIAVNDGTDSADATTSALTYTLPLTTGASAKIVIFENVFLPGRSLRLSVTNNSGTTTAGSGNEMHVAPYTERIP